jgi:hypothetical protein
MLSKEKLKKLNDHDWQMSGAFECSGYAESIVPDLLEDIEKLWKVAEAAKEYQEKMSKYCLEIRMDWSDFDGRSLLQRENFLSKELMFALKSLEVPK